MAFILDSFSGTPQEGKGLRIELDYTGGPSGSPVFVGYAPPGKATSDAVWKVMKLVYNGSNLVQRLWADGDTKFDNVWDDRVALNYS